MYQMESIYPRTASDIYKNLTISMIAQPNKVGDHMFHERTDTFELDVSFLGGQTLTITMKDFVDSVIYFRNYTEEDIGKDINRKMDLIDVYTAFAQTRPVSKQNELESIDQLKKYKFGTVIKNENQKLPCYKIQKSGIITVYSNFLDLIKNNEVTIESKLLLEKMSDMTQLDKNCEKQILQDLRREILKERSEGQEAINRLSKLEQQGSIFDEEIEIMRRELMAKDKQLENQINSIKEHQISVNQELMSELDQIRKELKSTKQLMPDNSANYSPSHSLSHSPSYNHNHNNQIHEVGQDQQFWQNLQVFLEQNKSEFSQMRQESRQQGFQIEQVLSEQSKQQQPNFPIFIPHQLLAQPPNPNPMQLPQLYLNQYKTTSQKVQYIGSNRNWTHYIFNHPISPTSPTKFRLKILQTQMREIMIGVLDYDRQKGKRSSFNSGNALCCYGWNGRLFPGHGREEGREGREGREGTEAQGFKEGDVVDVEVDRVGGRVRYGVNGVWKANQSSSMLADTGRVFMPFVEMCDVNDSVEWLS